MNKTAFLAKMRRRQKLVLTFLIRRLRNRGKNGCEALSETNRSTFSDFENNADKVFEKTFLDGNVLENSCFLRKLQNLVKNWSNWGEIPILLELNSNSNSRIGQF